MEDEFSRTFRYAWDFYRKRLGLIVIFSIPFILAFLIPALVPAPTYVSLGGVFLRIGSIPEFSVVDLAITAIAYALAVFVISDTIVNINIIVRSKRTLTSIKHEVMQAVGSYAMRIFYIYTMVTVVLGIVGALVGGFIGRAMGFYQPGEPAGWLMSILGAIVVLAIYRAATRRRTIP